MTKSIEEQIQSIVDKECQGVRIGDSRISEFGAKTMPTPQRYRERSTQQSTFSQQDFSKIVEILNRQPSINQVKLDDGFPLGSEVLEKFEKNYHLTSIIFGIIVIDNEDFPENYSRRFDAITARNRHFDRAKSDYLSQLHEYLEQNLKTTNPALDTIITMNALIENYINNRNNSLIGNIFNLEHAISSHNGLTPNQSLSSPLLGDHRDAIQNILIINTLNQNPQFAELNKGVKEEIINHLSNFTRSKIRDTLKRSEVPQGSEVPTTEVSSLKALSLTKSANLEASQGA